ncbi:preprotein translocase subunit SecY [Dolichospermum sp. UHCC 0684]|jgi:preprotein translocase subunit SecY|uniref:Protein translocase subunit SecY n=1 Tax=Dolichospermum flos-aquae CCAP 1403/13F TaxID=315271 RepID=A0A6H2BXE2_DOLFA|nr:MULTISPECIES: preprotein translocase subunit SecY [Nostocales]MBJ7294745.1 preprotein translocase subunit SecY [Dolichospermum sp.]MBO1046672.1 preprotein translocase subunit SecY [Dolichospermum sp. DEX182a]MBO1052905.1 preprotein translocase subunit SecY [Dolichospermum sp. DET73]MBS9386785.1 preprotein translocase subunit SecY [Dolichospermum sp. BR01]MBS9391130.1 preprotein translocase subunit SecY [Dolichospermum sp. WA123]MBS9395635.1 preprotein translocase subunit SecY [Dolichosperm
MISRDKAPTAQETFMQMAQAAGLRGRLLVTVGILILVRLGIFLPVPGIDRPKFAEAISGNNSIFGLLDIFSGRGLSTLGVFALGILPFINASIIIQLLTSALPSLENLQKNEGEAGRRKISQITRYVTVIWAIIQSVAFSALFLQQFAKTPGPIFVAETAIALTAGSMFVMWASELITERGIGNGASLLIFVNIVASLPKSLGDTIDLVQVGGREIVGRVIVLVVVFMFTIVGIVFVQEGMRRIPIISARRQVGRRVLAEQRSYLPLRLNSGGVMPIIFAAAILSLPLLVANFTKNPELANIVNTYLSPGGSAPWVYALVYLTSIVFFSYFYSSLILNPVDVAQNLKKMGSSIPGIRPGKATSEYIERVTNRLTFLGAIFLGLVAIIPTAVESALKVPTFKGLGATSLLILVGVAIDTAKQIQTYVISQRYEGMVKQ